MAEVEIPSPRTADDTWTDLAPGEGKLSSRAPQGTLGNPREVVENYRQALDQITQEMLRLTENGKLVVVWCFDQSESMKDDQQEIRDRIDKVYAELAMAGATKDDFITTAVTSFGEGFAVHTPVPTADIDQVRKAIDAVPIDPSGEEMMCHAVAQSIGVFRPYARSHRRQMALILVTDESGDQEEGATYLEATVAQALSARCPVYVLGREAVFGTPFAYVNWVHPQTGRTHELPVERGPETAFAEQLQTEGFQARNDAHPSGFGPYTQTRLAWRTGGVFFMLPTVEADLVRGEKRRYRLEAMEQYQPDLRSWAEVDAARQRSPLRSLIYKIVNDMNPYRKDVQEWMTIRDSFDADPAKLQKQIFEQRRKTNLYYTGLQRAIKAMKSMQRLRDQETSARWQANYDLMYAQLVAYAARVKVYGDALAAALRTAQETPPILPDDKRLVRWRLQESDRPVVDNAVAESLNEAELLYLDVIRKHPGTPWAARAEWELKRDFDFPGVAAVEEKLFGKPSEPMHVAMADGHPPAGQPGAVADATSGTGTSGDGQVGVAVDTGVGVGVGGGGGGGGGGGAGVGIGTGIGLAALVEGADWGVQRYKVLELVPEYRSPPPPKKHDTNPKPRKPQKPRPKEPTIPIPKL